MVELCEDKDTVSLKVHKMYSGGVKCNVIWGDWNLSELVTVTFGA